MKIIYLNVWGDDMQDSLVGYLEEQAQDTDIFCLQEATAEMKRRCRSTLLNYVEVSSYKYISDQEDFPQATYIRKDITICSSEILMPESMDTGLAIVTEVQVGECRVWICNVHGRSQPKEKRDDAGRIRFSNELIQYFENKEGPVVIGGDFNLFPDTQSIQMFSERGYRDLVNEFAIETTRNHLAWDRFPVKMKYSDYIFLNDKVALTGFSVTENEVSDHLPLAISIAL